MCTLLLNDNIYAAQICDGASKNKFENYIGEYDTGKEFVDINDKIDANKRSYVRTVEATLYILLEGTDELVAWSVITAEYEYADGSWAQINKVNIYNNWYSGYRLSDPYNTKFYTNSECGGYEYYVNLTNEMTGSNYKYYISIECSIYGDITYDTKYCGKI